jgi:hypothetical protein
VDVPDEDESFDWTSYLREGDEKFICVYDDSSSVSLNIILFLASMAQQSVITFDSHLGGMWFKSQPAILTGSAVLSNFTHMRKAGAQIYSFTISLNVYRAFSPYLVQKCHDNVELRDTSNFNFICFIRQDCKNSDFLLALVLCTLETF